MVVSERAVAVRPKYTFISTQEFEEKEGSVLEERLDSLKAKANALMALGLARPNRPTALGSPWRACPFSRAKR